MTGHIAATYQWRGPGGRRRTLFLYTTGRAQLVAEDLHWDTTITDPAPAWKPSTWLTMRRQLTDL
jgi:hypothetical protein